MAEKTILEWQQGIISAAFVALSHENTTGYALRSFVDGSLTSEQYEELRDLRDFKVDELIEAVTNFAHAMAVTFDAWRPAG